MSSIPAAESSLSRNPTTTWRAAWIALIIVWNVAFVLPLFGPLIHESDQASLLEGAVIVSQTGTLVDRTFYNYDKQFGTYWVIAGFLNLLGAKPDPNNVVMLGNAVSVIFFNAGLLVLVFAATSSTTFLLLACLLFSPSFIVHAPFLAGNYLSAFFLFAQFTALTKSDSRVIPIICAFCATACRADAVLAQPILLWSTTNVESLSRWIRDKRLWGCAAAVGSALLLGSAMTAADASFSSPFAVFLNWKILTVYSIFGLGAGIGILTLCIVALRRMKRRTTTPLFALAGLLSLLLPFAYYVANLYSTRHWTVALAALMCFVASSRGRCLVSATLSASRLKTAILVLLLLSAGLPVLFGLRFVGHGVPRFTVSQPALVPSSDGLIPLGSYLSHSWGWNRDQRQIPDHNQATWLAALAANFESSADSDLQLLVSPLASILQLAARLRGFDYQLKESPGTLNEIVYTEFRALRKAPISHSRGRLNELIANSVPYGVEFASPLIAGEAVVRLTPTRNGLAEALDVLRSVFAGNDYHILNPSAIASLGDAKACHLIALISKSPFRFKLGTEILTPERSEKAGGEYYYLLKFVPGNATPFAPEGVAVAALSVLPAFMTIDSY